nr:Cro/CI family transcriptional regulator [Pseudomonas sp. CCOS 191]
MRRITLGQFANEKGQTKAAGFLGMSQSALNKALQVGREIFVIESDDGGFSAEEIRPFPSQPQQKKSAA